MPVQNVNNDSPSEATKMKVLFVDDEQIIQELMREELPRMGYQTTVCPSGETAVAAIQKETFDCLIVDLNMPGMGGIEVIEHAKQMQPNIEAVIYTGKPSEDTARKAIEHHVFAYLTKPTRLSELSELLGRINQSRRDRRLLTALKHRLDQSEGGAELIGVSSAMQDVKKMVSKVAATEATVLIRGETGCGKELVARAVHAESLRGSGPLVPINCGALPEHLIESELFGHTKGAFTGADTTRVGLFEVANGGTIFLDEIGELPLSVQAKLLRVLESGDIRRVGDNQSINVDVRVVCATHRDLEAMVTDGTFREDLMFRINTFEIVVPPLRERRDDIRPLADHLLSRHRREASSNSAGFTEAAYAKLDSYIWPGNVRELSNVIEHAAILCDHLPIDATDFPAQFGRRQLRGGVVDESPKTLRELEMQAIERAMNRHDGNKPAVAEELGVSLKTLYNRLNAA